jgi:lipoyl(octanoyl) transferase
VARPGGREDKIAAVGVRVRHWISYHGIAINLDPELEHFSGIVPCGIASGRDSQFGVTSLYDLGILVAMAELDSALKSAFAEVFADAATAAI